MKNLLNNALLTGSVCLLLWTGCVPTRVIRTQTDQAADLSGRWNDTDSRLVAAEMTHDFLQGMWLQRFQHSPAASAKRCAHKVQPVIIVCAAPAANPDDQAATDAFVKDLEKRLVHQGEVRIVANSAFREKLWQEKEQQVFTGSTEVQQHFARGLGADYMLFGHVSKIVETIDGQKATSYQADLELVQLETNEKVWVQETTVNEQWTSQTSKQVATSVMATFMQEEWAVQFQKAHSAASALEDQGKPKPVVVIGTVLNKSHEHIEASTFISDMEKAIIENGEVRLVANSTFRDKLRQEKVEQVVFASAETQKRFARELGADYMLFGSINSIVDAEGKNKVIFYQVNLELVHLETGEKVWIGEKKIKKYVGGRRIKKRYQG